MNPSDHGVRDFVSSLHCTVTSQQRRNLLNHLLNQFHVSQDPVALSQALVAAGFVHGLVLHLGFVLSSHPQDAEIICQALASVYHHCPESIMEASVQEAPDLMPLLIRSSILDQHNNNSSDNNSQLLQAIFSIWHSCSSSAKLSFFLLREQGSFALLPAIVHVLRQRSSLQLRHEEQVELLGCLKNLSYYAEEEQRSQMVQHPGFLAMLIHFSSQAVIEPDNVVEDDVETTTTTGKIPERLSAVFRNLALQPNTRQILSQQPDFIGALLRLATNFTNHHHHRQIVILRNVLNTLQSLALEEDSCVALVLYGDGMVLDMLHRLLHFQSHQSHQHHHQHHNDDDATIRKRTARIARLLASSTRVVHMIVYHSGLMETLLCSAMQDANRQVRMDATKSFCHCASVLQASMHPHLSQVLDGLACLLDGRKAQDDDATLDRPDEAEKVTLVVRACQELAANPYNRMALVKQQRLLERLASIAMASSSSSPSSGPILEFELDQPHLLPLLPSSRDDSSVRADIVYTFYHLSQETAVQAHLIAIPAVIQSLVWNAQSPPPGNNVLVAGLAATNNTTTTILTAEQRRRRDYAIATLVHLASSNDANRATLVSYSGLLPVLIHFAATAQQQQQQQQQQHQQQQQDQRQPNHHQQQQQQQQHDTCTYANKASVKSTIMQLVAVL